MAFDPHTSGEQAMTGSSESMVSPESGASRHRFVSFFLDGKHYAMPAHAVSEVVGHLTPTRLPDAPPALLGIAPLRGDILAVVETGASDASLRSPKQKAVVLRPQNASIELPIAFNVDRLGELLQIAEDEIRFSAEQDTLASFESYIDGKPVLIIEPARIQDLLSATDQ